MLPRLATYNTYVRSFQYKLLNDVLFLNKKLHIFGIRLSPLCSFCNLCNETHLYIFYECDSIKFLWSDLVHYFQNSLFSNFILYNICVYKRKKKFFQALYVNPGFRKCISGINLSPVKKTFLVISLISLL